MSNSIQKQVFDALRALVDGMDNYVDVMVGPLPEANGISMAISTGGPRVTTLAHGGTYAMDIVLNTKHENQIVALDTLASIHEHLNKTLNYPTGGGWAITSIATNGAPGYLGRDEKQWLYGSGLTVEYIID